MPLLHCEIGDVQNGKKIGISGALLPEKTCHNKRKHVTRPQAPRKREKPEIKHLFVVDKLNQNGDAIEPPIGMTPIL